MKFALLIAAVSAVTIRDVNSAKAAAPTDSGADPLHTYSIYANSAHQKVVDADAKRTADQKAMLARQAADDAWRKGFNPKA